MTLRVAYGVSLAFACTAAMFGVLGGGEFSAAAYGLMLLPWLGGYYIATGKRPPSLLRTAGPGVALAIVLTAVLYVVAQGVDVILLAAAGALLGLLALRMAVRESLRHDIQGLLISLLLVFAGAGLHLEISYALAFGLFSVAATWALVLGELWRGAESESLRAGGTPLVVTMQRHDIVTAGFLGRIAGIALAVLALTSVVFVTFPRVGIGALGLSRVGRGQLSGQVSLNSAPRGQGASTSVVARLSGLTYAQFSQGLYLRSEVFELYDGSGFRPGDLVSANMPLAGGEHPATDYQLFALPIFGRTLPVLGPLRSLTVLGGGTESLFRPLRVNANGQAGRIAVDPQPRTPVRYQVHGTLRAQPGQRALRTGQPLDKAPPALLALPPTLDRRVAQLARDVTAGASEPETQVSRIVDYFARDYKYDLDSPSVNAPDPLSDFLFNSRSGHCEFFAAATAVLLRSVGVPARVVGGFAGGSWDDAGVVVFAENHAHAWVEWFSPVDGWISVDATPVAYMMPRRFEGFAAWRERVLRAWDEYILDYDLVAQLQLSQTAFSKASAVWQGWREPSVNKRAVGIGAGVVIVGVGLWLLRGRLSLRRRQKGFDGRRLARGLLKDLARLHRRRRGADLEATQSVRQALTPLLPELSTENQKALTSALTAYEMMAFGEKQLPRQVVQRHRAGVRAIAQQRSYVRT